MKAKDCEECGARKPDVRRRIDPFEQDIENRTVYRDLCDDCEKLLSDEI